MTMGSSVCTRLAPATEEEARRNNMKRAEANVHRQLTVVARDETTAVAFSIGTIVYHCETIQDDGVLLIL